ncbi:hypothetical protein BKH42_08475 [Helicobacter sp. 13S00482-2]|uniref:hypothetical protein n=1 Tax=Helicobacter sp. 13S00482-2 TaxID=1476200 RepID=UPI000BA6CB33|nr:hypothetical protein [Helicobacter sp. 13S00482-2]PAF52963.1 hypothetical protein BKH42_08475 [Helicobacter sp. 13S00482-2]
MTDEDKVLFEKAKKMFGINSLKELAVKLGRAESSATNWYKTGFPKSLRYDLCIMLNVPTPSNISVSHTGNHNNVIQQVGAINNDNINLSKLPPIDENIRELVELLITYATPKIRMELKEKLLAIKALEEG